MIDENKDPNVGFTPEQLQAWGLTEVPDGVGNNDQGLVTVGDTVYQIENFERQQNEGLDTDQGTTFGSDLYAQAQEQGFEVTNFNTATDVEGALNYLAGNFETIEEIAAEQVQEEELSPELQQANKIVNEREASILDGSFSSDVFANSGGKPSDRSLLDKYKTGISVDYRPSVQSMLNAQTMVMNSPIKSSSGNDAQTQFPSDSWVWN